MPTFYDGLPTHILLVHGATVLIPLGALTALALAVWPASRRRYQWPAVGAVGLGLLFSVLASSSGEGLQRALPRDPLIERHTELAGRLTPLTSALAAVVVLLVAAWIYQARSTRRSDQAPRQPERRPG